MTTELLVGTKKGLFVLRGDPSAGEPFEIATRAFPGDVVEFAIRDPRTGRYFASHTSGFYGPRLMYTDDPAGEWTQAEGPGLSRGGRRDARTHLDDQARRGVTACSTPASRPPRCSSRPTTARRGRSTSPSGRSTRPATGSPAPAGSRCTRSVRGPATPAAGGRRERGGRLDHRRRRTVLAHRLRRASCPSTCPRRLARAPTRSACTTCTGRRLDPERLFMQFHGNVYRSDDAGLELERDPVGPADRRLRLPAWSIDPADPDSAYVIPLVGAEDRVTPDAQVRVYETRDAGSSWTAHGEGLPASDAYLTIYRQAFGVAGRRCRRWSSTSAPRAATSSARPTPERRGSRCTSASPPSPASASPDSAAGHGPTASPEPPSRVRPSG